MLYTCLIRFTMTKSKKRGSKTGRTHNGLNRNQYQRLNHNDVAEDTQNGARSTLGRIFGRATSDSSTQERNVFFSTRPTHENSYSPTERSPLSPLMTSEQNPMSTDLLIDIGPEHMVPAVARYLNEDPYNSDVDTTSRHTSVAEEDVCFPQPDIEKHKGETDYEALEEFLEEENSSLFSSPTDRPARKSSRNIFSASPTDINHQTFDTSVRLRHRRLSTMGGDRRYSMYGDRDKVNIRRRSYA